MSSSPMPPPSRRELNKAATRAAIVQAAFGQLESAGYAALTAESVADAAGVSRRTFFNYFPSIEAALNEPTKLLLENAVAVLDELDPELDLLSAAVATVESLVDPALLEPIANLYLLASEHPQMARMQLEAWNDCAGALTGIITARAPHGTPLAATVFAHCVIGAGKAAFAQWSRELAAAPDPADPRRTHMLRATLAEAIAQLRDGFPSLQQRAQHTRKA
ncbi:AcrR family transcriptional regulator [Paeniglutamicibacter psychrophenolicus]|uniref:AcrR family transcriptional regulator n=2 Tax=Paeniglutamicibacter psychrophenolicus TaxID=257454 RepID=A0ABS4WID0_9MICC|nr:AcrR family transcriptional regulator [Paeniglutamicibacter psychrophenolicus]